MAFPTIPPTSRQYAAGDWPVRKFSAQNGSEVRLLYGDRRVGHTLTLQYENITDAQAERFFTDYNAQKGTFSVFAIPNYVSGLAAGWKGSTDFYRAGKGALWRYAEPPVMNAVYPGVSSVTIKLVAVGADGGA